MDKFTGLLPFMFKKPYEEIQIYNELYYVPSVSYFADKSDEGFFPIAYGCPGGLPEEPDFTPERMLELVQRFEAGEHSNGMPEPMTVDLGHAGAKGGYPQDVKAWMIQLKTRPFNDLALFDVQGNPGVYNKMPEGSLVLCAKAALPLWSMWNFQDSGIKASVSLFKVSEEAPWLLRNTGLVHVQCLRALPAWAIDKVGFELTQEQIYAREEMKHILQEIKERTGETVTLNSPAVWQKYVSMRLNQAKKEEKLDPTKMENKEADETKTKAMNPDVRTQLKTSLVSVTGDQFAEAAEAYIAAIEATADTAGDAALADTAGQALIGKLGGSSQANSDDEGKLQNLVDKAVSAAIDKAVEKVVNDKLNAAKPKEVKPEEKEKLNAANLDKMVENAINLKLYGGKPNLGSQTNGVDTSKPDPFTTGTAEDVLIRRR